MTARVGYERFVVGIDFSSASLVALEHAAGLAKRCGARLDLVHVLEDTSAPPWSSESPAAVQQAKKRDLAEAKKALDALSAKLPREIGVATHVLSGAAYVRLSSFAKRKKAGLIVLANVGRSRLVDVLMGSTAHRMVGRSSVPLLLVPTPSRRRRS